MQVRPRVARPGRTLVARLQTRDSNMATTVTHPPPTHFARAIERLRAGERRWAQTAMAERSCTTSRPPVWRTQLGDSTLYSGLAK
jgi:hypothetical protein